jgi:deoxyribonuclease-1-like protein
MMGRLILVIFVAAAGIGGWYVWTNFQVEVRRGPQGNVEYVKLVPRPAGQGGSTDSFGDPLPPAAGRPSIRIATFNLDGLDENKLANPNVSDSLVRILPRFDIIAVQGVRSTNRSVLVRLTEQINATGRHYDYATCPTVEREVVEQYNAMFFDLASVEVDRSTVRSVEDPAGRFRYRPLCAAFRVRGPAEREAFTFTLINVQVDAERVATEVDLLADVFRAVRDQRRDEDDVILLGDIEADNEHAGRLARIANITAAIANTATTTRGTRLADNLFFDRRATVEFTGRAGVLDLIRELDLTPQAALEISGHLPVWAEFSSYEGGQAGHVAAAEAVAPR